MQNSLGEGALGERTLVNLRFLIELQVHRVSTLKDDRPESIEAHALLRHLMDAEQSLRIAHSSPGVAISAAA